VKEVVVKDVHEVVRRKEMDLARLQKEIESLRLVIPLLAEDEAIPESVAHVQESVAQDETGTEGSFFSSPSDTEWSFWKRHRGTGK
jgi:hypothetical protein